MRDRTCPQCQKTFDLPCRLAAHLKRKTSCAPIVEPPPTADTKPHSCKYCNRCFGSPYSLSRHLRKYCKIANSDEGMEKLVEHTLARQLAEQKRETAAVKEQLEAQTAKIDKLAALLEKQLAITQAPAPAPAQQLTVEGSHATVTNIGVQNVQNVTNHITIRPWSGGDQIYVTATMLRAAFAENPRLTEYVRMDGPDQVDAEKAAPYVLETLVDLVKRAHADPEARNIYLNPRRADQALIYDETSWKAITLVEAIRALFDGAARGITRIILSDADRSLLTQEVQSAAAGIPYLYEDEAEAIVGRARKPLSAHLANIAPPKGLAPA